MCSVSIVTLKWSIVSRIRSFEDVENLLLESWYLVVNPYCQFLLLNDVSDSSIKCSLIYFFTGTPNSSNQCSEEHTLPFIGWQTPMYRSTVKVSVSQMPVLLAVSVRGRPNGSR